MHEVVGLGAVQASLDPYLFAWFREDIGVPGQRAVEKLRKSRTQPDIIVFESGTTGSSLFLGPFTLITGG